MTAPDSGRELDPRAANLRERLRTARLYLCTDARIEQGDLGEFAAAVLRGGVDIIQLRHKTPEPLEARQELAALEVLADACRRHGGLLAVNDRADIASAAAADVLHLGQDDLPVGVARSLLGPTPLVGRSTHASAEVDAALVETGPAGSDYFCVGPCWPTPTKPGRPAPGLDLVRYAASHPANHADDRAGDKPWFAIGGINADNLDTVLEAGARRIVVVRALTDATDPEAAAETLARRLRAADQS